MRISLVVLLYMCFITNALAEYKLGPKRQFETESYGFFAQELFIDGHSEGFVSADFAPAKFSKDYLVYQSCHLDKQTREPDGCMDWVIHDFTKKESSILKLPGFNPFFSTPSFRWPYVAYVSVPKDLNSRAVSCVIVKWPEKIVFANSSIQLEKNFLATDFPGVFLPPTFQQGKEKMEVNCLVDDNHTAKSISTITFP